MQMCQLSNSHGPMDEPEELLEDPFSQSRMGQWVTVDPISVDQPAPGIVKQFNIDSHSGHIRPERCMPKVTGNSPRRDTARVDRVPNVYASCVDNVIITLGTNARPPTAEHPFGALPARPVETLHISLPLVHGGRQSRRPTSPDRGDIAGRNPPGPQCRGCTQILQNDIMKVHRSCRCIRY